MDALIATLPAFLKQPVVAYVSLAFLLFAIAWASSHFQEANAAHLPSAGKKSYADAVKSTAAEPAVAAQEKPKRGRGAAKKDSMPAAKAASPSPARKAGRPAKKASVAASPSPVKRRGASKAGK